MVLLEDLASPCCTMIVYLYLSTDTQNALVNVNVSTMVKGVRGMVGKGHIGFTMLLKINNVNAYYGSICTVGSYH